MENSEYTLMLMIMIVDVLLFITHLQKQLFGKTFL